MRVLLVRFSSLGDVVLATAAVEALAQDRPDAEVHVLTKPAFRDLFRHHPAVKRVLPWDPAGGLGALGRAVRAGGYQWGVDLHGNLRSRVVAMMTPGTSWLRYRKGVLRRRAAVCLRRPSLLDSVHVVDRYLGALQGLGVSSRRRLPRVYPGDQAVESSRGILASLGWDGREALVGLAPGARWATKAWPAGRWAELCREVAGSTIGVPVLLGGGEDAALCREVADGAGTRVINLSGETSVLETAAVLQRCAAVVTNDSAPLHLATAVGAPVVALFGPTVRGFGFYPLGPGDEVLERDLPCRPCSLHGDDRCPRGTHECLADLRADEVAEAVHRVVSAAGAARSPVHRAGEDGPAPEGPPGGRGARGRLGGRFPAGPGRGGGLP